jgi:EAL and modified HD-GYP domain-containing signal transduction protein
LDHASARVLDDAVLSVGLATLTHGRKAFVNLSRQMLLSGVATLLPSDAVVLELLENIPADAETLSACRMLKSKGYSLALDDFTPGSDAEAFLRFASFVKVDVLATSPADIETLAARVHPKGLRLVAEKVETQEMFEASRAAGCALFQGYFFCRPSTVAVRAMSTSQIAQIQLVAALSQPNVRLQDIEELLKQDPRLSIRVLRSVNSAGFGLRREIRSIREAVLMLGLDQIRKWASIWSLAGMNGGSAELVNMTIIRARSCELLGAALGRSDEGAEYFLLGLCSLLDAILRQPMTNVIETLPLAAETREALLGQPNAARSVLDAVSAYERGAWAEAADRAAEVGVTEADVRSAYHVALAWAQRIAQGAAS